MSKLIERLVNGKISRRDFLKGSATATAAVAGLSLVGCGQNAVTTTEATTEGKTQEATTQEASVDHVIPADVEAQG